MTPSPCPQVTHSAFLSAPVTLGPLHLPSHTPFFSKGPFGFMGVLDSRAGATRVTLLLSSVISPIPPTDLSLFTALKVLAASHTPWSHIALGVTLSPHGGGSSQPFRGVGPSEDLDPPQGHSVPAGHPQSLPPSADRCVNFPSREAGPQGGEFLGAPGDLFLWNKEREILQFLAASQTLGTLRVWGAVGRAWHAGQQGGTVCLDTERGVLGDAGHVGRAVARP